MKIAICPGTFDPVTIGHVDIILRASNMFDKVIVAVLVNDSKSLTFSLEERLRFLNKTFNDYDNIEVDYFNGLLADYAKNKNAVAIVRGLRAISDFEYEFQMALINKKLNPELETIFLMTQSNNMYLSSSVVKQVAYLNGDIYDFVPKSIYLDIKNFFERNEQE